MALADKVEKKISYSDYLTWPDDERWEILNGEAYNMSPAPSVRHQNIVLNLAIFFGQKLKGKTCKPFVAPTDVVFSEYDVVQPDVFVVCDSKKITESNIQGAPDLIIEVLSPSTALTDKKEKKALYEKHGVGEYILFDPVGLYAERFTLVNGIFTGADVLGNKEVLKLSGLEGLELPLWEIFEQENAPVVQKK